MAMRGASNHTLDNLPTWNSYMLEGWRPPILKVAGDVAGTLMSSNSWVSSCPAPHVEWRTLPTPNLTSTFSVFLMLTKASTKDLIATVSNLMRFHHFLLHWTLNCANPSISPAACGWNVSLNQMDHKKITPMNTHCQVKQTHDYRAYKYGQSHWTSQSKGV